MNKIYQKFFPGIKNAPKALFGGLFYAGYSRGRFPGIFRRLRGGLCRLNRKNNGDPRQILSELTTPFNPSPACTGFTLIELLVVVLIIGILSAVALPQYHKAVLRARAMEGLTLLRSLEKAEQAYYLANGQYTMDLEALDLNVPKFKCLNDYCQVFSSGGKNFMWEFNFHGNNGNYVLYCVVTTADAASVQICQSLGTLSHQNHVKSCYVIDRHNK